MSASDRISRDELARALGLHPAGLDRLIRLGLLEPVAPDEFEVTTVVRLRRVLRLRGDLGVNLVGAAIIVDLVEKLDRLGRDRS
jgi:hypothetical protein